MSKAHERIVKLFWYLEYLRAPFAFGHAPRTGQACAVLCRNRVKEQLCPFGKARGKACGVQHKDEMRQIGGRTLVIKQRTGLMGEIRPGQTCRQQFHHKGECSPLRAPGRHHRSCHCCIGIGGWLSFGIQRPAFGNGLACFLRQHDLAARNMAEREINQQRIAQRARRGKGNRVGAEQRAIAPPWGHGRRGIGEGQRNQPLPREGFYRLTRHAEMVRAGHTDNGNPQLARNLLCHAGPGINCGKGQPKTRIHPDHGTVAGQFRRSTGQNLSCTHLRCIEWNPRQPMRGQAFLLGLHQCLGGRQGQGLGHSLRLEYLHYKRVRGIRGNLDRCHAGSGSVRQGKLSLAKLYSLYNIEASSRIAPCRRFRVSPIPMTSRPVAQPLHRQLRDLMMARIEAGEWSPGTYLPSESRLAEDYGVAVGTLRKALLDMAAEGVVQRRQGKGTVVVSHDSDAVLFRFFNLRGPDGRRLRPESRVLSRARIAACSADADALGLPPRAQVIRITRVRDIGGTPVLYEHILLDAARFGRLETDPDILPNTLYQLYQTEMGATVHRAREALRAVSADKACARELGIAEGTPLLQIRRVALDYGGAPIELRLSWVNTYSLHYEAEL